MPSLEQLTREIAVLQQQLVQRSRSVEEAEARYHAVFDTALSHMSICTVEGVILDYFMPGMDGGQVAIAMRKHRPEVPILLLSAYVNLPAEVVQMVDFTVLKGEGPNELLIKIKRMLRQGSRETGNEGPS